MNFTQSEALHKEALEHIVRGVNSPSRAYKGVGGGTPVYMECAKGANFWDVDVIMYIGFLFAYGPIITDHAHLHVSEVIMHVAEHVVLNGTVLKLENKYGL